MIKIFRPFRNKIAYAGILLIITICSCSKGFLDKKPSSDILVPQTLDDFQKLLDNYEVMNYTPSLGLLAADDYYLTYSAWQTKKNTERNSYVWADDIYGGTTQIPDWNQPYQAIFYANNILAGLRGIAIDESNKEQWQAIKGAALFVRAYAYFHLADVFCKIYDSATADKDLGLPIKLNPEIDEIEPRGNLQQTYDRIFADLQEVNTLLPADVPVNNRNRPSKTAVWAFFSRIYFNMRDYDKALIYADSSLNKYNSLIDFNTLSKTSASPFTYNNAEVIYSTLQCSYGVSGNGQTGNGPIDTLLLKQYNANDLRKTIFFQRKTDGLLYPKRIYSPALRAFSGLRTDELYLNRAECLARKGQTAGAMAALNTLLASRWVTGSFIPYTASNASDALSKISWERRKELIFSNARWSDLRRLNKEGANIILTRVLNGQTYTLEPNSLQYIYPIPDDEIAFSGIEQNPR